MAHDLTKSFGAVRAVRGLDLSLQRGSTVALLGPNGAGKTTVIDMLIGWPFLRPTDPEWFSVVHREVPPLVLAGPGEQDLAARWRGAAGGLARHRGVDSGPFLLRRTRV